MNIHVDVQSATGEPCPEEEDIRGWITAVLLGQRDTDTDTEISLRIVDEDEMATLNANYRGKAGATNVLSFPADLPEDLALPLLGDIVICAPVVRREAAQQGKPLLAHWAHMTVHGTLHLLGFDHVEEQQAATMESLETRVLATLNFPCPYSGKPTEEHAQA